MQIINKFINKIDLKNKYTTGIITIYYKLF